MAYTPYGQAPDENQPGKLGIGGAALDYYKWKYAQYPGTYSFQHGVAMPFGIGGKKRWDTVKGVWKQAAARTGFVSKSKGFLRAGKETFFGPPETSRIFPNVFKEDEKIQTIDKLLQRKKSQYSKVKAQWDVMGMEDNTLVPEKPYLEAFKGRRKGTAYKQYKIKRRKHFMLERGGAQSEAIDKTIDMWEAKNAFYKSNPILRTFPKESKHLLAKATSLRNTRLLKSIGRHTLIGAGKLVSTIGMVALAADIAMMVGEPVGRALIQQANSTFSRAENRFMPEMGGQLNAAYLSYGAATERQRAVQAISKSYINGRSAYGQEAMYMHS